MNRKRARKIENLSHQICFKERILPDDPRAKNLYRNLKKTWISLSEPERRRAAKNPKFEWWVEILSDLEKRWEADKEKARTMVREKHGQAI